MNGKRRKKRQEEAFQDLTKALLLNFWYVFCFICIIYLLKYSQKLESFLDYFRCGVALNWFIDIFSSKLNEQKKEE